MRARLFQAAACAAALLAPAPAFACALALVLAIDVSSSVDAREYRLQTAGHAAAFRDPEVVASILAVGGIRAVVVHWSGAGHQQARSGWETLETQEQILGFADLLGSIQRRFDTLGTAIGPALRYLEGAWTVETDACARRVIDISGDGVANAGGPVSPPRERLIAAGVTINGLVITGADPDPSFYYRDRVVGGPGAFVVKADGFEAYAEAFKRKLLRELAAGVAAAPPFPAASGRAALAAPPLPKER